MLQKCKNCELEIDLKEQILENEFILCPKCFEKNNNTYKVKSFEKLKDGQMIFILS